jgi:hypothetical protein
MSFPSPGPSVAHPARTKQSEATIFTASKRPEAAPATSGLPRCLANALVDKAIEPVFKR